MLYQATEILLAHMVMLPLAVGDVLESFVLHLKPFEFGDEDKFIPEVPDLILLQFHFEKVYLKMRDLSCSFPVTLFLGVED